MKSHKVRASRDKVVTIHYTLTNDEGGVVDSSVGKEPLTYLHGHKNIVAGLESALAGKCAGDTLKVSVPPDQGYGMRHEEAIITMPRTQQGLPPEMAVGDALGMRAKNGQHVRATIIALTDDEVKLDCNHPLAGTTLNFEVEVVSVRSATPEELKHGHAHGPGGCS
jgi:FKBP-type peptidyl-prolyl cis-trans isomerase SlyD